MEGTSETGAFEEEGFFTQGLFTKVRYKDKLQAAFSKPGLVADGLWPSQQQQRRLGSSGPTAGGTLVDFSPGEKPAYRDFLEDSRRCSDLSVTPPCWVKSSGSPAREGGNGERGGYRGKQKRSRALPGRNEPSEPQFLSREVRLMMVPLL